MTTFPNNPTLNQEFTNNGIIFIFNGTGWVPKTLNINPSEGGGHIISNETEVFQPKPELQFLGNVEVRNEDSKTVVNIVSPKIASHDTNIPSDLNSIGYFVRSVGNDVLSYGYVNGQTSQFDFSDNLIAEVRFKILGTVGNKYNQGNLICSLYNNTASQLQLMYVTGTNDMLLSSLDGSRSFKVTSVNIADGDWHTLRIEFGLSAIKNQNIKIDNILLTEYIPGTFPPDGAIPQWSTIFSTLPKFVIGGRIDAGGDNIHGLISQAKLYIGETLLVDIPYIADPNNYHYNDGIMGDYYAVNVYPCKYDYPHTDDIVLLSTGKTLKQAITDGDFSGGGHTIKDATTAFTQRIGLKFTGNIEVVNTTDDTVVNVIDSEALFFDDITVKAKVSRPYNFTVSTKTESGGTGTITTSSNAAYTLGTTITANDYVQVAASAINARVFLTLTRV